MEIISIVPDEHRWHIKNAEKQCLAIQPELLVVWSGYDKNVASDITEAVKRGQSVYQYYYYQNRHWPVDPLVWVSQRKEVADHHKLAGRRWIENSFSNFFPFKEPIIYKNLEFHSPENYYQAMKSRDPTYQALIATCTPSQAKRLSKEVGTVYSKRGDWFKINIKVMFMAQRHRIQTEPLFKDWLIGTEGRPIIEWVNWEGDNSFWGCNIDSGNGLNWGGRILMMIRDYRLYEQWEGDE